MRFSLCMFPKNSLTRFLFSISISTSLFWFNSKSKRPSRVLSVRGGSGERVAVLAWTLVIIAHQTPRPSHPQELSRTISSLIMRSAWGDRVHTRHAPSDGRTDELHPSLVLLFLVSTAAPRPTRPFHQKMLHWARVYRADQIDDDAFRPTVPPFPRSWADTDLPLLRPPLAHAIIHHCSSPLAGIAREDDVPARP